jgi:hypothetical protein
MVEIRLSKILPVVFSDLRLVPVRERLQEGHDGGFILSI